MQRVSAFIPSWDRRLSSLSAPNKRHSNGGGIFSRTARNSINISGRDGRDMAGPDPCRSGQPAAKALAPINVAAANNGDRVYREAFWPSALDMESLKAARILKSFCLDGFLAPEETDTAAVPAVGGTRTSTSSSSDAASRPRQNPAKVMRKIPKRVIQNAAAIAVFTCMRSGLWMTGSGGSGILIARKSDGTWSPPSGIMLHTPTLSFIIGVDVYDCVLVVTNLAALEAMTRPRVTLGEDVSLHNGPCATMDEEHVQLGWKNLDNTVLAYMKARGHHQSVNLQGCILTERANENERFYGAELTQMSILAGNVARHVEETKPLFEVIKLAEGRTDYDKAVIESTAAQLAPSDAVIATPRSNASSPLPAFGIIKADDPDPFGILALEMAGLEIREAGSRVRPPSSQLDMASNPCSPSFSTFDRQSVNTFASRSNRASVRSLNTIKSNTTDACTQTVAATRGAPGTTPSPAQSEHGHERASIDHVAGLSEDEDEAAVADVDYTAVDLGPLAHSSPHHPIASVASLDPEQPAIPPRSRPASSSASAARGDKVDPASETQDEEDELGYDTNDADDEDDVDVSDEEPVIIEVAQVQPTRITAVASRMIQARGSVVTIAKRIPPPLPTRSPARTSRCAGSEAGAGSSMALSPLRSALSEADLQAGEEKSQERNYERRARSSQADDVAALTPSSTDAIVPPGGGQTRQNTPLGGTVSEEDTEMDEELARAMRTALPDDGDTKHMLADESESVYSCMEDEGTEDEGTLTASRPTIDDPDFTTNGKKHTSSIYTRLTEDGWSIDRSSLTTPTSERPMSVAGYTTEEETPRKTSRDEEPEEAQHQNMSDKVVREPPNNPSPITIGSV